MARLIILNGPPGIGKSTVARRYVEDHPMTLSLEQDLVRGLLGGWRTRETESGALARDLCVAWSLLRYRTNAARAFDAMLRKSLSPGRRARRITG